MEFTRSHTYQASPAAVHAMLTDESFWTGLVARVQPISHTIAVTGDTVRVDATLPAPAEVSRFVGATLRVTFVLELGPLGPDQSARGPFRVEVHGAPAELSGTGAMFAVPAGTQVDYRGEFTIRIPLLGRKLEQSAAPQVLRILDEQAAAGRDWLASHG